VVIVYTLFIRLPNSGNVGGVVIAMADFTAAAVVFEIAFARAPNRQTGAASRYNPSHPSVGYRSQGYA